MKGFKGFAIGLLGGIVLTIVAVVLMASQSAYQFMVQESLSNSDFDKTVAAIQETVIAKGWQVPKVYRLDETMAKHGHPDVLPVAVIELCQPEHAYKLLKGDETRLVTSFMPCRISIYETSKGEVIISRMNSGLLSQIFPSKISETMGVATQEVEVILTKAQENLAKTYLAQE